MTELYIFSRLTYLALHHAMSHHTTKSNIRHYDSLNSTRRQTCTSMKLKVVLSQRTTTSPPKNTWSFDLAGPTSIDDPLSLPVWCWVCVCVDETGFSDGIYCCCVERGVVVVIVSKAWILVLTRR